MSIMIASARHWFCSPQYVQLDTLHLTIGFVIVDITSTYKVPGTEAAYVKERLEKEQTADHTRAEMTMP